MALFFYTLSNGKIICFGGIYYQYFDARPLVGVASASFRFNGDVLFKLFSKIGELFIKIKQSFIKNVAIVVIVFKRTSAWARTSKQCLVAISRHF